MWSMGRLGLVRGAAGASGGRQLLAILLPGCRRRRSHHPGGARPGAGRPRRYAAAGIPDYALDGHGKLAATALFYARLMP